MLDATLLNAEPARGITLRIKIDQKHLLAHLTERSREVDCRRRFPDAAFLVDDRHDLRLAHHMLYRRLVLERLDRFKGYILFHLGNNFTLDYLDILYDDIVLVRRILDNDGFFI